VSEKTRPLEALNTTSAREPPPLTAERRTLSKRSGLFITLPRCRSCSCSVSKALRSLRRTYQSLCRSSKDLRRSSDAFHERPLRERSRKRERERETKTHNIEREERRPRTSRKRRKGASDTCAQVVSEPATKIVSSLPQYADGQGNQPRTQRDQR
jgi:hypothetical protein